VSLGVLRCHGKEEGLCNRQLVRHTFVQNKLRSELRLVSFHPVSETPFHNNPIITLQRFIILSVSFSKLTILLHKHRLPLTDLSLSQVLKLIKGKQDTNQQSFPTFIFILPLLPFHLHFHSKSFPFRLSPTKKQFLSSHHISSPNIPNSCSLSI